MVSLGSVFSSVTSQSRRPSPDIDACTRPICLAEAPDEPFTYLDNALARDITATYGMRFFASELLDDPAAREALGTSALPDVVDVLMK